MRENTTIPRSYFLHNKVTEIAEDLIGKVLCTQINNVLCRGVIIETEAYSGYDDKACHAHNGKRTKRTEIFYRQGGIAYVYLCYGIHHLFNIITNHAEVGDAVLIRSLAPIEGIEVMQNRMGKLDQRLCSGPGKLSKAMGISMEHNGIELSCSAIWVENTAEESNDLQIEKSKRIGVEFAGADANKLWRFSVRNHPLVSKSIK